MRLRHGMNGMNELKKKISHSVVKQPHNLDNFVLLNSTTIEETVKKIHVSDNDLKISMTFFHWDIVIRIRIIKHKQKTSQIITHTLTRYFSYQITSDLIATKCNIRVIITANRAK